jgi:hypothetical protein|tara:strand:+ start:2428 stop:2880 length:453 start_codon:yes stop_codon:yes gene_type:complete
MTIYIASVNAEGHANNMWVTGVVADIAEGVDPNNEGNTIVHIDGTIADQGEYIGTHYYKDGVWLSRDACPSEYHNWESEAWVLDSAALFKVIRQTRDHLLFQSDWTQLADSPLTDDEKAAWVDYRLALRSVPADNSGVTSLDEVTWPVAP